MKWVTCHDCKNEIEASDSAIIIKCGHCGAIYAIGEKLCLQLSGIKSFEWARLNADSVIDAITAYQNASYQNYVNNGGR